MCSYYESTKTQQYIVAVMEIAEVASREGWRIRGSDQEAIEADILERFKGENIKENEVLIEDAREWMLYSIYALPPNGRWTSPGGRCILLGDAAYAVRSSSSISISKETVLIELADASARRVDRNMYRRRSNLQPSTDETSNQISKVHVRCLRVTSSASH